MWARFLGQENPFEKEMATHSSILTGEISWTEEPGELQTIGSQKSRTQLRDYTTTKYLLYHSNFEFSMLQFS